MKKIDEQYEIRFKEFIDKKLHEINVVRPGYAYSKGYREAMEDIVNFLDDMVTMKRIYSAKHLEMCEHG